MLIDAHDDAIEADLERREKGHSLIEEGHELSKSLFAFNRASWHVLRPDDEFVNNWHIGAMCDILEAVTAGELDRVLIWVPPGSMKTLTVDVDWPAWEWTLKPSLRYMTISYDQEIQIEQGMIPSRDLILSDWYQARWPHVVLKETRRAAYTNTRGGARWAAAPNAKKVTGRHVHRMILDDPNDANSAEGDSDAEMERINNWHDGALGTRLLKGGAKIVIQQRLHENDLSGHLLENNPGRWYKLCLPESYDPKHQFVWPEDPRTEPGELLWPALFDAARHAERIETMGARRAAGQLQQEPAPRSGEILKREYWRYYPPEHLEMIEEGAFGELPPESPFRRLRMILISWDTSLKELNSSDDAAGGIWGIYEGDRFLLKTRVDKMNKSATKTAMLEQREWALARFPHAAHRLLIEKKSNGVEIIADFKRTVPGLAVYNPGDLDKIARAKNAEGDFDSGNVWICGAPDALGTDYDPARTPAWAQKVIEQCAKFPKGRDDDLVDMTTQAINWVRFKGQRKATLHSPENVLIPALAGVPSGLGSTLRA